MSKTNQPKPIDPFEKILDEILSDEDIYTGIETITRHLKYALPGITRNPETQDMLRENYKSNNYPQDIITLLTYAYNQIEGKDTSSKPIEFQQFMDKVKDAPSYKNLSTQLLDHIAKDRPAANFLKRRENLLAKMMNMEDNEFDSSLESLNRFIEENMGMKGEEFSLQRKILTLTLKDSYYDLYKAVKSEKSVGQTLLDVTVDLVGAVVMSALTVIFSPLLIVTAAVNRREKSGKEHNKTLGVLAALPTFPAIGAASCLYDLTKMITGSFDPILAKSNMRDTVNKVKDELGKTSFTKKIKQERENGPNHSGTAIQ